MKKTITRETIEIFLEKKAINEKRAICINDIQDESKKYIISKLVESGHIIYVDSYNAWFDINRWKKDIKFLTFQYLFLLIAPTIIFGVIGIILIR